MAYPDRIHDSIGMWKPWFMLTFWLTVFVVVMTAVIGAIYLTEKASCNAQLDAYMADGYYDIWAGCLVQTDRGNYVPFDNGRFDYNGEDLDND